MRTIRSRASAGALVAVLAATFLLPLGSLARFHPPKSGPHGCHCLVKMTCCEAGLCHGGIHSTPSSSPSWSGCRDEAPDPARSPAPSTAFDAALLVESASRADETGVRIPFVTPAGADARGPEPETPPPQSSILDC